MQHLHILLLKFAPAFSYVLLGYAGKRWLRLSQKWVAFALFYVFVPLVVFKGALLSDTASFTTLVALSMSVSTLMVLGSGLLAPYMDDVMDRGVLRCALSYFNIGWFGVPIVYGLWGEAAGMAMTGLYVGGMLFGNTIGYLMVSSPSAVAEAEQVVAQPSMWQKLLKIPSIYAMLLGFALHFSPWLSTLVSSEVLSSGLSIATWVTSVLGMGLVGMSVAGVRLKPDHLTKLSVLLVARVLLAVFAVTIVLWLVGQITVLPAVDRQVLWLLPLLPIAANILVFSTKLEQDSAFVGMALLFSTLLSGILFVGYLMWGM